MSKWAANKLIPRGPSGNCSDGRRGYGSRWHLVHLLVLGCVGWTYWPVWSATYVWDDLTLFVQNGWLRSGDLSWAVLSQPILPGSSYFRPMVLLSFVLEFKFAGSAPVVSHGVNLVLLMVNVALVYSLACGLLIRARSSRALPRAALAALLYAVHPALTESTAWISGRFDLMVTTFALFALNAEVHVRNRWTRNGLVALSFLAALGCKESAVILPPALLLLRLAYDRAPGERLISAGGRVLWAERIGVLSLGLAFALYLIAKARAMGNLIQVGEPESVSTVGGHLLLVLNTLAFYAKLVVIPFGMMSPLNPLEVHNVPSATNGLIGLFVLIGVAGSGHLAKREGLSGFLALAGMVALLPVLNVVPLSITNNIGHSRFLALPLVFFCIGLASAPIRPSPLLRPRAQSLVLVLALSVWIAAALATTRSIVPLWNNQVTLWRWAYAINPDSRLAAAQFAVTALRSDRIQIAGAALERIHQRHGSFTFHEQLFYAEYLARTGNLEEATHYLRGMTDALPPYHSRPDETAARLEMRATSAAEILQSAYALLGIVDAIEGRSDLALRNLRAALWYQPKNPKMIMTNALFLEHFGRPREAKEIREIARLLVGERAIPAIERGVTENLKRYPALALWFSRPE